MKIVKRFWILPSISIGFAFMINPAVSAQSGVVPSQSPQEAGTQQPAPPQDPIAQLNLTPQQRQQIRAIRVQNKDERAAINLRVNEAQKALDKALDAQPIDEALIEQSARELGEARAASIRMQALTEMRIRRVLTPEQIRTLKELRALAQQIRRGQRLETRANDTRSQPNQGNGIMPSQRRDNLLRRPRP